MRQEYFDPIERFPDRIDQLLDVINRVCHAHFISSISILIFSYILSQIGETERLMRKDLFNLFCFDDTLHALFI